MEWIFDIGGLGQYHSELTAEEKKIRNIAFFSILNEIKDNIESLATKSCISLDKVKKTVNGLARRGLMVLDKEGYIVGSHGLSLVKTEHLLYINGRKLFTWCAADAIGIPGALGLDAHIVSKCHQCNKVLEITVNKGKIEPLNNENIQIWVIEADLGRSIVGCA